MSILLSFIACQPLGGNAVSPKSQTPTIFWSKDHVYTRVMVDEAVGSIEPSFTGKLSMDGNNLNDEVQLHFEGIFEPYGGGVPTKHEFVLDPTWVTQEEGAANPDGYLKIDLRDAFYLHQAERRFGEVAGVFVGDISAHIPSSFECMDCSFEQGFSGERFDANSTTSVIHDTRIEIRPIVAMEMMEPAQGCTGTNLVDGTIEDTELEPIVAFAGFPPDVPVTIQLRYLTPNEAYSNPFEAVWDLTEMMWNDQLDEEIVQMVAYQEQTVERITFPAYTTEYVPWQWGDLVPFTSSLGASYDMEIIAEAWSDPVVGPFAVNHVHGLTVAEKDNDTVTMAFELCPIDDVECHERRDENAPENVIARRNIIERHAFDFGLYDPYTAPVTDCEGGDRINSANADYCKVYQECQDSELETRISAELEFELTVNGEAKGGGSWEGSYNGIEAAAVEGAFQGEFSLGYSLDTKFESSQTWADRTDLTVVYDPSDTQIQWWRTVVPRIRYLQIAQYDACGIPNNEQDLYMTDLTGSKLALACESAGGWDEVCHAVEPNDQTIAACDQLLLGSDDPEFQECIQDLDEC